ncbi:MAG: Zn-dependent hydrolase [Deltaproteobacteria bacterium]|nr:Zn-dependent hydrolase [Deltaproteobacteria bacterium]
MKPSSKRVIADLEELAALTTDERGAQRVAWGPVWRKTRDWFTAKLRTELGLEPHRDGAGNLWATLPGASPRGLVIGSHLDSVPGGGWLDGCLGVLAGLEVLRRARAAGTPPLTLHLVDWADEEGARFGRSLAGSAASAGTLDAHAELAHLVDRAGVKLPDALAENGVTLDGMGTARAYFDALGAIAYLELHIEQGPVLESMRKPTGLVLGTMGVERHNLRFVGQAAHSGAAPIHLRKDAFLAAAEFALACRDISVKYSGKTPRTRVVATCGVVKVEPNFVTAVPGSTEISIDLRALDATVLKKMLADARRAAAKAARTHKVAVSWSPLLHITPRPFDPALMTIARTAIKEVTGTAPELPSGPLHDAAEMAAVVPTAMIFAQSSPGISHTKLEDTPRPALDKSIRAFLIAVDRTVAQLAGSSTVSASGARSRTPARRPR